MKIINKLTLPLLFISAISLGQITIKEPSKRILIGEVKNGKEFIAEISYKEEANPMYCLVFKNEKYSAITDLKAISFSGEQTLNDLYKILQTFFVPENKSNKEYKVDFKLGNVDVSASNKKGSVWIWTKDGYFTLSESQVNKLFGKK